MIKRRGKLQRGLFVMATAVPSAVELVRGVWSSDKGRKWMTPLIVFLCVTGLVLVLATSVEALAPFIYTIF